MTGRTAEIVVVGAGVAGLRCAAALHAAGHHVAVLEAADHIGGRVSTERIDGFTCDRGFQVLNPAYPAMRRAVDLRSLQLSSFDSALLVRTEDRLTVLGDPRRAPGSTIATLRSGLLDPADLWALARWLAPVLARPQQSMHGDDTDLAEALRAAGATGRIRRVLDRFLAGVVVDSHGQTSARFVRLLLRSFVLGRPGLPAGGMQRFPELLAAPLPDVRTQTMVRAVTAAEAGHGPVVHLDDATTIGADAVVIAADPAGMAGLSGLPPVPMKGLTTWWYAAAEAPDQRRMLAVDGRGESTPDGPVWNAAVISTVAADYAPAGQQLIEATTLLDRPDGSAGDTEVRRHLAAIYGCDTSGWQVVAHHVIPEALPAMPPPVRLTRPVGIGRRVFVCGDHRDTPSLQGALVSGERAARAVLREVLPPSEPVAASNPSRQF